MNVKTIFIHHLKNHFSPFLKPFLYKPFLFIFVHHFLLFVNIFIPKTGCYKYNNGGTFFVLFYLIPFCRVPSLLFF